MFRRWLSSFIKKNKDKILEVGKKLGLLCLIALIATSIISIFLNSKRTQETEDSISIYNPERTMISGKKITKEEFEKDDNVVNSFINYCNDLNMQSAYKLLSDDCKKELYPTVEDFKEKYCSNLFKEKREYNLQSWMNEGDYHIYRLRFTDDMLSSGVYNEENLTQDYITVFKVSDDEYKLNINGFIKIEEINKESDANALKALCINKKVYLDYEVYTIKLKNKTSENILLDTGKNTNSVVLRCENNTKYFLHKSNSSKLYDELSTDVIRKLEFRFDKPYSVNSESSYIEFSDIVTDINEYKENKGYKDRESIKVELK